MIKEDTILTIRISSELKDKFKIYCDDNGFALAKRLKHLIKKDIDGKIDITK